MSREPGFYWVRMEDTPEEWKIARYDKGHDLWMVFDCDWMVLDDDQFIEIDERRIERQPEDDGK